MKRRSEYRVPFQHDTSYAYSVGRIRALETRLLTRQDFSRLVGAADTESFFRILSETAYGALFPAAPDPDVFEDQLQAHLGGTLQLIGHLSHDPEVTGLLACRYDYHNLKRVMKARMSGHSAEVDLLPLGLIDPAVLARLIEAEGEVDLPRYLRRAVSAAEQLTAAGSGPQGVDVIMDREMFAYFTTVLERSGIPFLSGWLEREIDHSNIKTFFRLVWAQDAPELIRESLSEGGSLATEFYRKLQDEPKETLAQRFATTRYGRCVDEGVSYFQAKGSFARLEGLSDSLLITYLRASAYTAFGVEPLMAYGLLKEFEIKALRTAAVGKLNAVPQESIQERLPDVYL